MMLNEFVRGGAVFRFEVFGVPFNFLTGAKSDIAEQRRFGESARIAEVASGRRPCFAGLNPFLVMADGLWNEGFGTNIIVELFFRHEHMPAIIGEEFPFF